MTDMTPEELIIAKQKRVIANLRRSYIELQNGFRGYYREVNTLRFWILVYATCHDDEMRQELDATLMSDHLSIWQDLQRWRKEGTSATKLKDDA